MSTETNFDERSITTAVDTSDEDPLIAKLTEHTKTYDIVEAEEAENDNGNCKTIITRTSERQWVGVKDVLTTAGDQVVSTNHD